MSCTIGRCEICGMETHSPEKCGLWNIHEPFKQAYPFKKVYMLICKECAEQLKEEFAEELFKDDEQINNWIAQAVEIERAKVAGEVITDIDEWLDRNGLKAPPDRDEIALMEWHKIREKYLQTKK